jgi:L-ascorbate metabolism protein UlaG (beta-lactamase superfamily)
MDAVQGVELLREVPARRVVPVHYDDYRVFRSPVQEFVQLLGESGLSTTVRVPGRGDSVPLW